MLFILLIGNLVVLYMGLLGVFFGTKSYPGLLGLFFFWHKELAEIGINCRSYSIRMAKFRVSIGR